MVKKCNNKKNEWLEFKRKVYHQETLRDVTFKRNILTQPVAIKIACDFAKKKNAIKFLMQEMYRLMVSNS